MHPSHATPIAGARDIETIEQNDYATWVGARSTYELLRQAAEARPQAPAIVYVHDPTDPGSTLVWTHAELLDRVHRAAALLRGLGIRRDAPVALLVPHTPSAQVALWAAQLAGCAFPINFLLNAEHVAQLLRAAGARVIVALGPAQGLPVHDTVDRAVKLAGGIEQVLWLDSNELGPAEGSFQSRLMAQAPDWPDHDRPVTTDLAALYHTGGTTGLPKLLQHTHANEIHTSRSAPPLVGQARCTDRAHRLGAEALLRRGAGGIWTETCYASFGRRRSPHSGPLATMTGRQSADTSGPFRPVRGDGSCTK